MLVFIKEAHMGLVRDVMLIQNRSKSIHSTIEDEKLVFVKLNFRRQLAAQNCNPSTAIIEQQILEIVQVATKDTTVHILNPVIGVLRLCTIVAALEHDVQGLRRLGKERIQKVIENRQYIGLGLGRHKDRCLETIFLV